MAQFQVPQFIETEDKIVGPFTLRQFGYIAAAGVLIFILYFMNLQLWAWATVSIAFLATALGLAFVKVEGRTLPHVLRSALHFYWQPQTYVWQSKEKRGGGEEMSEKAEVKPGISIEDIVSGAALKRTWQKLQVGERISGKQFLQRTENKYQIFQKASGERRAARRVDYR